MRKFKPSSRLLVQPSFLSGEVMIPASKSHTIRSLVIAALANGTSEIDSPLESADTISCAHSIEIMGAGVKKGVNQWIVKGFPGNRIKTDQTINVGNSGTTLRLLTAVAALSDQWVGFDGDSSIRMRPMAPLLNALIGLGVKIDSGKGKCPFSIKGPMQGGKIVVDGISSQYVSALLMASPLAKGDIVIRVENLHEKPYVQMTLDWLNKQAIIYQNKGLEYFKIKANQFYKPFQATIPADFSSATFPLCAAAVTGSTVVLKGLDFSDSQGDKKLFSLLEEMGVSIKHGRNGVIVSGGELNGMEIDLRDTPDALPAMAVVGCYARGETRLVNVPQARLKECDRITAIAAELSKMGADVSELADGLIIRRSQLKGTTVHGYSDHRMVMALTLAGLGAQGITAIDTAESIGVTYPSFIEDMQDLGAKMELVKG